MSVKLVATFAGDSGDGIQLLGGLFSDNIAKLHFSFNTLPDFPAEIRAPAGTQAGVSGFQIQWGNDSVLTAGHYTDVFIAFNAAALVKYLPLLKPESTIIYDPNGFDEKNYKKAKFSDSEFNALTQKKVDVSFSKLTISGLDRMDISTKEKDQNKNFFALGFLLFGIGSDLENTIKLINNKFLKNPVLAETLAKSLKDGYHYAETIDFQSLKLPHLESSSKSGDYKNVNGNKAIALSLLSASKIYNKKIVFGGYPITPASDILQELSKFNVPNVEIEQAEDEMGAAGIALGASYAGAIGVTASSGPGFVLKQETIALAMMAEVPLLIIDVQRAGPSTGMPTKIEQSDLELALYGRHGESPVPVIAIASTVDAYETIHQAIEIMLQYQTPVIVLSDALIANSTQLWKIPDIVPKKLSVFSNMDNPMARSAEGVRSEIHLGEDANTAILGGLEKDIALGTVSYQPENHSKMTQQRADKLKAIQAFLPETILEPNSSNNGTLIVSWGSTYGAAANCFQTLISERQNYAHLHLKWLNPLPKNLNNILSQYKTIIVPELNSGQLARLIQPLSSSKIVSINKIEGLPFYSDELYAKIKSLE